MRTAPLPESPKTPGGRGRRFAVVASRFNRDITERLLRACLDTLQAHDTPAKNISVAWVPGAFELPLAARRLARNPKIDAVIALGCVIRGETPHDRYISQAVADGLMRVALDTDTPVIFGVLTTLDSAQARARAGEGPGNKGAEAARAALEMVALDGER